MGCIDVIAEAAFVVLLMAYFPSRFWCCPQVAPGRLDLISLNSTELANVNFLLDYQNFIEGDIEPTEPKLTESPPSTEPVPPAEPIPQDPSVPESEEQQSQ